MILVKKKGDDVKEVRCIDKVRIHWEEFPEWFPQFIVEKESYMSNCCGGFSLNALMKVYCKKIEGDIETIMGLSTKQLIPNWFKLSNL